MRKEEVKNRRKNEKIKARKNNRNSTIYTYNIYANISNYICYQQMRVLSYR